VILFHFTCSHGAEAIEREHRLRPNRHPWLPEPLLWLTDLVDPPNRDSLGLTSHTLRCDRMAYRFAVDTTAERWGTYAHRIGLPRITRDELEGAPGALPGHWWVAVHTLTLED
jgi:hypothetical protein